MALNRVTYGSSLIIWLSTETYELSFLISLFFGWVDGLSLTHRFQMPKMNGFLHENHWGGPTFALLNVLGVLNELNALNLLNALTCNAHHWPAGPCL